MLIATLPGVYQSNLSAIINTPEVGGVRYNVGVVSPYSPLETLQRVGDETRAAGKQLWIDLKGRQLRIANWSSPNYGKIILNHEIEVDCPAAVIFRGDDTSEIRMVHGNVIYVDPPPRYKLGEGQSINIHGSNLRIRGYLTPEDRAYIKAACELGINAYMLSFIESEDDILEVLECIREANGDLDSTSLVLKIESVAGLKFVVNFDRQKYPNCRYMAARDDLMLNIGDNKTALLPALELLIRKDPDAIVASRIFSSLAHADQIDFGDIADLRLMQLMGYKHFMLSDGICWFHFDNAIRMWKDYLELYPM